MKSSNSRIFLLVLVLTLMGSVLPVSADDMYYVVLTSGGVEAFPADQFSAPETLSDGTLSVTANNGQARSFAASAYSGWSTETPLLPVLTSFKFNNKFNPSLHRDAEATDLPNDNAPLSIIADTLRFSLNAIGKSLTPSFKVSDPEAVVYAEGAVAESKVSRYRFDHDITFTVTRPGCVRWAVDNGGQLRSSPLGHAWTVHVDWLTDNPQNVPQIHIDIEGGKTVTSKETYLKATISILGMGVYDDFPACDVWIKGRGNTSWGWPKKPYRLRFDEKVKPFGLTAGRSWVLLSNYLRGSLFANALAFKSGQLAGVAACNHIVPVELYINGSYRGSYMFTEKVGFGNNSIDADDTADCLLELSREYDEPYRFRSNPYNLPVNIKEPDFSLWEASEREERKAFLEDDFNRLALAIYRQSDEVQDRLDIDACARFLLVNDLNNNVEINHPKSTFLFKEDMMSGDSKYVFGPIWDFDWAYGFARTNTYFDTDQRSAWLRPLDGSVGDTFFGDLMKLGVVKRYYYKVWMDFIRQGGIDELKAFLQDYYDFAHVSFEHDMSLWKQNAAYQELVKKAQRWLDERADYIVGNLDAYDLTDFDTRLEGDVNRDGVLTVTDAVLTFDYLLTGFASGMDLSVADVNYDGNIDMGDVVCIVRRIVQHNDSDVSFASYGQHSLAAQLMAQPFEVELGECTDIPLQLTCDSTETERYHALQCDIHLPKGLVLMSVTAGEASGDYTLTTRTDGDVTRVVLMPSGTSVQPLQECESVLVVRISAEEVIDPLSCHIHLSDIRLTTDENDEEQLHPTSIAFAQTTGLCSRQAGCLRVMGGHSIVVTALEEQDVTVFAVDGKFITTLHVLPGTNTLDLPTGVYVIAGQKAVVY